MSSWRDRIRDFLAVEEVEEEEEYEEPELDVPGAVFIEMLYPKRDELEDLERFALGDKQNVTLPITLSVPEPGVNSRLVFEMHRFEDGEFVYHERWNQLWLNVTETG